MKEGNKREDDETAVTEENKNEKVTLKKHDSIEDGDAAEPEDGTKKKKKKGVKEETKEKGNFIC